MNLYHHNPMGEWVRNYYQGVYFRTWFWLKDAAHIQNDQLYVHLFFLQISRELILSFWVIKLLLTVLGCYDTNVRLFTYLNNKLFSRVENIESWQIIGKQNKFGWKSMLRVDRIDFIDIDWLISIGSLMSTYLTRWFDLFNYNP